eukprot:CAMPEP_0194355476 /NCGR_PEP_ID=MMETSP0174-20130528/3375_1 /TAXON_ID=216777 /ORGANISM="Proboscia alata, Strain PI-D3" /LENGTH=363 /DNA_ID=CAMNT_0039124761 /DNA_START=207 /DNA_END=1298 /DNA_ORIENTATION=-
MNDNSDEQSKTKPIHRVNIEGVSVSSHGFVVLLSFNTTQTTTQPCASNKSSISYLPIQISNDPDDEKVASSVQALTYLQLLGGIDMAGAVLPPELLPQLVCYAVDQQRGESYKRGKGLQIDGNKFTDSELKIIECLDDALRKDGVTFVDASAKERNNVKCPKMKILSVEIGAPTNLSLLMEDDKNRTDTTSSILELEPFMFTLELMIDDCKSPIKICIDSQSDDTNDMLQEFVYSFNPHCSGAFTVLCLAQRYKCPIYFTCDSSSMLIKRTLQNLDLFPEWRSTGAVQNQSETVVSNINRGFEVHNLQKALQIAVRLGDVAAERKIQAKIQEYDSFDELPVVEGMEIAGDGDNSNPKMSGSFG